MNQTSTDVKSGTGAAIIGYHHKTGEDPLKTAFIYAKLKPKYLHNFETVAVYLAETLPCLINVVDHLSFMGFVEDWNSIKQTLETQLNALSEKCPDDW